MKPLSHDMFLGSATMSEKGQVVIPVEARKLLGLKKGEKLLVFQAHGSLIFSKVSQLESYARILSSRLSSVQKLVRKAKPKKSR